MIKTAEELNLKVKKARLLKKSELKKYESVMPYASSNIVWWLGNTNSYGEVAYAEGNYNDKDMYCQKEESNTHLRVALDIAKNEKLQSGEEFTYCGYIFTVLSESLAISNNFLGCAKYYDEEIAQFAFDEVECTLDLIIGNLFGI